MERSFKKNTMFTFKNLFEDIKQAKIVIAFSQFDYTLSQSSL